jgi:hypothetical protein
MKILKHSRLFLLLPLLILFQACATWDFMPDNRRLITENDLNEKTLTLYAGISDQNQQIKILKEKIDSLQSILDTTRNFLHEKDIEIDQLRAEIRVLNRENNTQFRYLQDMIIEQSITLDSLFAEFVEQQDFELFLTDLRDVPKDEQSALFLQKQLGTLKARYDSLSQQVRTVVQHQHFLREDLTIVESSIMDIIKFSSDKYLREIERRHDKVMSEQEMLADRQDSLITAYNQLIEGLTDFAVQLRDDREIFRDSVDVILQQYQNNVNSIQKDVIACLEDQALLQTQLRFFRDNLIQISDIPDTTSLDTLFRESDLPDSLYNHEN